MDPGPPRPHKSPPMGRRLWRPIWAASHFAKETEWGHLGVCRRTYTNLAVPLCWELTPSKEHELLLLLLLLLTVNGWSVYIFGFYSLFCFFSIIIYRSLFKYFIINCGHVFSEIINEINTNEWMNEWSWWNRIDEAELNGLILYPFIELSCNSSGVESHYFNTRADAEVIVLMIKSGML